MSRVLVGVTTRNRPEYVRKTVESVVKQSYSDIRVIVSENPSDHQVAKSVSAWVEALADPRVSYRLQPVDGGEYGQGRFLVSECREPYFCILHDDDLMDPDYLEQAVRVLDADPSLAFFSSSQYLIDAEGKIQPELTEQYAEFQARDEYPEGRMENTLAPLLEHGLFSISGAVFRASCVKDYGLVDQGVGGIYPFEFNVFLRIAERRLPAWYSPRRMIAYRWHDTSMRQSDGSILTRYMVETLVDLLQRRRFEGKEEGQRRRLLAFNLRNLGYILLVAGEQRVAIGCLIRAIRLHPLGPSLWAYLAGALFVPGYVRKRWASKVNLAPPSPSWAEAIPAGEGSVP